MKTKTYTIKVGEVFTKQKAKELEEHLELIGKDYYQVQKKLRECLKQKGCEWCKREI